MIIGIGSDLIDIRRVAKVIERHGERFLDPFLLSSVGTVCLDLIIKIGAF